MSNDTVITVIGNLTGPPELRFTPSGAGVANFTVASTPRSFDKNRNEWVDGETLFLRCSVWRQQAENLAESDLTAGTRVMVQGRLRQRSYEKDGQKRTTFELEADEVAVSAQFATVSATKASRSGGQTAHRPSQGQRDTSWGGGDNDAPF